MQDTIKTIRQELTKLKRMGQHDCWSLQERRQVAALINKLGREVRELRKRSGLI